MTQASVFLLDNYDSFTYNLVQLLAHLETDVTVARNDEISVAEVAALNADAIVISPGPSLPERAGIGVAHGGRVVRVPPVHGKRSTVCHSARGSFRDLPSPISAARYHSLAIDRASLPPELEVTAWSPDGLLMGVAHRSHPVEGFQFHPESILTDDGAALVGAFLSRV